MTKHYLFLRDADDLGSFFGCGTRQEAELERKMRGLFRIYETPLEGCPCCGADDDRPTLAAYTPDELTRLINE